MLFLPPNSRRSTAPTFRLGHQGKDCWKDLRMGMDEWLPLTCLSQGPAGAQSPGQGQPCDPGCLHLLLEDKMKILGSQ